MKHSKYNGLICNTTSFRICDTDTILDFFSWITANDPYLWTYLNPIYNDLVTFVTYLDNIIVNRVQIWNDVA